MLELLRYDVRLAIRSLRREPAHSLVAVLILAIGIGANTAVFSVVNPLLLKPLPFPAADRLVWIENTGGAGLSEQTYRVAAYEELARQSRSFDAMSGYFAFFGYMSYTLTGTGVPERLSGVPVAPGFLEILGVAPVLGRGFSRDEFTAGDPGAVLLSDGLWRRRFGADPAIVGRTVTINGAPAVVAGVLPASFDFSSTFTPGIRVDLLVPARLDLIRHWGNTLSIIGRLKPGVSLAQAQAELGAIVPPIEKLQNYKFGTAVVDLKSRVSGAMRRALVVLWAAVGLVLLIVCANLSNLLLARTAARSKEFAVRMALGASRGRIVSQLLAEGVLLAGCGAVVGIPLAFLLTGMLKSSAALAIPLLHQVHVDGAALAVTAVTAIVSGLAFGAIPALRVAASPPQDALKAQGRGTTDGRQHGRVRSALVVSEVALATVLLVGAGLLLKSFVHILDVDLGFQPTRAIGLRLEAAAQNDDGARRRRFADVARRVREVPGVEGAGLTDALPLDRNRTWGIAVPGRTYKNDQSPDAFVYIVGPGYLQAMGIAIRNGRDFNDHDVPGAAATVPILVNETLARTLYPDQDPVGRSAATGDTALTIVGVVADVRQMRVDEGASPQMYLPFEGDGGPSELIVRSTLPPSTLATSLRSVIHATDASVEVTEVRELTELVDRAVSPRRFLLTLLAGFSGIGLLLASLGIYGVISYGVAQRRQEIGVRMALGATAGRVQSQVMRETLRLVFGGLGAGLLAALALARLIATLLYDTSPVDPVAFGVTALLLVAVAALAGYLPALRASRVEPMAALRAE
jgi:predicted permease